MPLYRDFTNPKAALGHLEHKLRQLGHPRKTSRMQALQILARADDSEPRLLTESDFRDLPADVRKRLKRVKRVHLDVFHRTHPLLRGESIVDESYAVLADDWREYPKGSVAVIRTTNICKEIHVFPYLRLEGSELREVTPGLPVSPDEEAAARLVPGEMVFGFDIGGIVGDLYIGLLKGLLNKATTMLFESLFPPGPPAWIEQVYTQMRGIVHTELDKAMLTQMQGQLRTCAAHVHDYNLFREEQPRESLDFLTKAYDICLGVTGQLTEMGDVAALHYCVAVGQLFLIMQELASTDSRHQGNPVASKWSHSIQELAPTFAKHAEERRQSIIATRLKCISEPRQRFIQDCDQLFYFCDTETNYVWKIVKGCTDKEVRQTTAARAEYYARIQAEITCKVKDIAKSVEAWNQLAKYPLPRPEVVA